MFRYSVAVIEHFSQPRNVGLLDAAAANVVTGRASSTGDTGGIDSQYNDSIEDCQPERSEGSPDNRENFRTDPQGDWIQLQLSVNENSIIADAKFKAYGNPEVIAVASLLTDIIIGLSIEQAAELQYQVLIEKLELEQQQWHYACLADQALKSALRKII